MTQARTAELVVKYNGRDISADLAPFLVSAIYNDNADGKADDITIVLEDRAGRWRGDWLPDKGAQLDVAIVAHGFGKEGRLERVSLGAFNIDEIEISGWPSVVNIKATSTNARIAMRQERRTQAWENIKLSAIASEIAARNKLDLLFDGGELDVFFERQDQVNASDLNYISGLSRRYGLACKVDNKRLVIYDQVLYEGKKAAGVIELGVSAIKSYRLSTKLAGTYKSARVSYHDAVAADDITATADAEDAK